MAQSSSEASAAPTAPEVPPTQRAYTLRLRGKDSRADDSWREAVWATHEAVNKGAKAFGDWLLTLRGGLCHTLADGKPDRRAFLALSWLSVESTSGAPPEHIIAAADDSKRVDKVIEAFTAILEKRGISNKREWLDACYSLRAEIRHDSVWVNRSAAFDEAVDQIGSSLTRDEVWDVLGPFFGSKDNYFKPVTLTTDGDATSASDSEEKQKDLVQKAGRWLSNRFGTGKGADFATMHRIYSTMSKWAESATSGVALSDLANVLRQELSANDDGEVSHDAGEDLSWIKKVSSYPGHTPNPVHSIFDDVGHGSFGTETLARLSKTAGQRAENCKKNIGAKGPRPWANELLKRVEAACGLTYLSPSDGAARHWQFAVMLDHAARRVSAGNTWIKRAEAERKRFEEDAHQIGDLPDTARQWLDNYCRERSGFTGALEGYRIRRRAVDGWEKVVKAWSKKECIAAEDRIAAARALQDDPESKFGDIQLFEALAADDAQCVWKPDGTPDPQPLVDYVAAMNADSNRRRFKVPRYCHPDPLRHPVFCDFGKSRWSISFAVHEDHKKKNRKKPNTAGEPADRHDLTLKLWDGSAMVSTELRWHSKRLMKDLSLSREGEAQGTVSRADRLGRAASDAADAESVAIAGLFDLEHWNGRLQAPRDELNVIARRLDRNGGAWDAKAHRLLANLRWLITFSAKLQPQGPWIDYIKKFSGDAPARPFITRKGESAIKHIDNDKRKGDAKLALSRLPGLRVLSVDLGHRYAAACAVWETLNTEQVEAACRQAGAQTPDSDALYLRLKRSGRTTIYRRIGPDELPDGSPHPAPWARLDRQFLIKLQGEDRPPRKASCDEVIKIEEFEEAVGLTREKPRTGDDLRVDNLMAEAVRTARLALRCHGDYARIAWGLTTKEKPLPGGQTNSMDDNERTEHLQNLLMRWSVLAISDRYRDEWAHTLWREWIVDRFHGPTLPDPPDPTETRPAQRRRESEFRDSLKPVAEKLAQRNNCDLSSLWRDRWSEQDTKWKPRLKWLNRWILPRGRDKSDKSIRNVGGLSLTRIATIKTLYQVQKAFYTRPWPKDPRAGIEQVEEDAKEERRFGTRALRTMERMREQRVKQLASRIAEAALGVGSEDRRHWDRRRKRPRQRINGPRFAPCHAVVIENLRHYRPEETRTRRENRQLMTWSSSKVKKYLSEACRLHGLHLREVPAAYTSRQDSRTGAPGIRCVDVPVSEFLRESGFWRREIKRAQKKCESGTAGGARERYLINLYERWKDKKDENRPLRIPHRAGEVFVSAHCNSPAAKGIQADLNAAANIGLRALLDPDWSGRWWYVPCYAKSAMPVKERTEGSAVIDPDRALPINGALGGGKRETVNLWRDPSSCSPYEGEWQVYGEYWNKVQDHVVRMIADASSG